MSRKVRELWTMLLAIIVAITVGSSFDVYAADVTVTTRSATNITETNATAWGAASVGYNGPCDISTQGLYFGTSSGNMTKVIEDSSEGCVDVDNSNPDAIAAASITFDAHFNFNKAVSIVLDPGTTYYYQFFVVVDEVEYKGSVVSFTTKQQSATTETDTVTETSSTTETEPTSEQNNADSIQKDESNGWKEINNTMFYYENGKKATGWKSIDGERYYFNNTGEMKTGWTSINHKAYYLDVSDGHLWTNTTTPDGYKVDGNGAWIEAEQDGWKESSNHRWMYYENGERVIGLKWIDGYLYCFDSIGYAARNKTYNNRYFGDDCRAYNGWLQIDTGLWKYYIDGILQSGWLQVDGKWYYLSEKGSGLMQTGWQMVSEKYYYLDTNDGHLLTNTTTPDGYQVDGNGVWIQNAQNTDVQATIKARLDSWFEQDRKSEKNWSNLSYKGKASSCHAYCNYAWKGVFGYDQYDGVSTTIKEYNLNNVKSFIRNNARVGDILRLTNAGGSGRVHSMIIEEIKDDGIVVYELGGSGHYSDGPQKRTYKYSKLNSSTSCFADANQCWIYKIKDSLYK